MDVESFQDVALSRPELRDASPATLCSVTWSSGEEGEQEQLISKLNIYVTGSAKTGLVGYKKKN